MKKIYILFLISFFNLCFSQTTFHDTQGNIDVNGGGQLQYTLPIALPPGIKSVAPQINLTYTSGSGNGIAGYGWSLSGITSISRTGKTLEQDSEVSGINFGYSPYQFNGQRLIYKSGGNGPPYGGADGSVYTMEKYSNIKIKAVGAIAGQIWQGPEYWEVTFEDGSQAWYGATAAGASNARTPIEYNIAKWKDAQGNYINYTYSNSNNVSIIRSIQWGGNETINKPFLNEIIFDYDEIRDLKEFSYLNGLLFEQNSLLSSIQVKTNGSQFKKYVIIYANDIINNDTKQAISHQFIQNIQEFNSQNEPANLVTFATKPLVTSVQENDFGDFSNVITSGDYNGDGLVDFIVKQPSQNGRPEGYYLYFDAVNNGTNNFVYLGANGSFDSQSILTYNIKSSDGYVKPRQGLLVAKSLSTTYPTPATGNIELKYYNINSDASVLNTTNNPLILEYSKVITATNYVFTDSQYPPYSTPANYGISNLSQFENPKEVDIDSDGMSELIFAIKDSRCFKSQVAPYNWSCNELGYRYAIIDDNDLQSTTVHKLSNITSKNILSKSSIMDFDNNGRQDIMSIKENGTTTVNFYTKDYFYIYNPPLYRTFNTPLSDLNQYELLKTGGSYTLYLKKTFTIKGITDGIQFGDLNGDKNIEVLLPIHENTPNTIIPGWSIYLNTGNELKESIQGLMSYKPINPSSPGSNSYYVPKLLDLDNDGKSEITNTTVTFVADEYHNTVYSSWFIDSYNEPVYDANNLQFKWTFVNKKLYNATRNLAIIAPIFGDFRINNSSSKILFLVKGIGSNNERKIINYKHYNLNLDKNVKTITQGGITTEIDYKELDPFINPNLYAPVRKDQYPYMELDRISQSYVVSQIRQAGFRKQDFRYRGLITHLRGKGMIGFRQSARSSWYADGYENTKIWSGAEIDPLNDSVPIKEWSIKTNDENKIFPTDLSVNNAQLLSFKQTSYQTDNITGLAYNTIKAIIPVQSTAKDFLKDITTVSTITYGEYYLPNYTETKINGNVAVKTTELHYLNNPLGIGKDYYIGRPNWKLETVNAYNDTKQAKEVYTYNNNLLDTLTKYDNNNSGWIKEKYYYDEGSSQGFGNITKKETTNSVDSQIITSQTQYEPTGRFVIKKIDNLGLQSEYTYNNWGQVFTEKDPLGNTVTNNYDYWGKPTSSISSLSGTITYTYQKDGYNNYITTQNDPDGNILVKFVNVLGQNFKTITKAFEQNKYTAQETRFDNLGRKTYESDPYFATSINSNYAGLAGSTITYDDTVFPTKVTTQAPNNGKKIETSISGNTTTLTEKNGYQRIYTKTIDALGNVVSSTDPGGTITFGYNANGQQTKATYAENVVTTSYDEWGRKSAFNDPANGNYEYEYTALGSIKVEFSPKGSKRYYYKANGLLESVTEESNDGVATDKSYTYTYNQYGQLTGKSGNSNGKTYTTLYGYHPNGRLWGLTEYLENREFRNWDMAYDSYGNIKTYKKEIVSNGITTSAKIENFYNTWDGSLYQVKEQGTGKLLWELQSANAKGQVLNAKLGAAQITNVYSSDGFISTTKHTSSLSNIVDNYYMFDHVKNELVVRTNYIFGLNETFTYDNNNRLISWTNPKTGQQSSNAYDAKGRITLNDQVGTVTYGTTGNVYRATKLNLNTNGTANYGIGGTNILLQNITYNENNDPVKIRGRQNDYAFEYGLSESRQVMAYGGKFENSQNSKFTKIYSEDGSFEILRNNQTGQEKHIIYIGGTPYETNIMYMKDMGSSTSSFYFLHKDYLGSILGVTNESGYAIERRHYDAWGNFTNLKIAGASYDPNNLTFAYNYLVDRGYTSHEHLLGVGLIHMNGRLYDPLLRRFLNADENIQDSNNTQNYNKYGYVMNNPLLYSDPSGEFIWFLPVAWAAAHVFWATVITGAVIGAAIGASMYAIQAQISGNWSWGGLGKSILMGSVTGAVSAGLGQVFSAGGFWATVGNGALAGAGSGGVTSIINGTNFLEGLTKGAVIGGAVAGITYSINYLVRYGGMKDEFKYYNGEDISNNGNMEYSNKTLQTMRNNNYTASEIKQFKVGGDYIGSNSYSQTSDGFFQTSNGKAFAYTTRPSFWTGSSSIHYAKAAFASKELLFTTMAHETGHSYIMYAGNYFVKKYDGIKLFNRGYEGVDNLGHAAIFDSENYLSKINNFKFNPAIGMDKDIIMNAVNNNVTGNNTGGFNILKEFLLPVFNRKIGVKIPWY